MKIRHLHPWDVSFSEAVEIQKALATQLLFSGLPKKIELIAGTDVSFSKRSDKIWAGVVVLEYPSLVKAEERSLSGTTHFPYIPGLLSFREIPIILDVLRMLEKEPDVIFCDGQGIAHPRGLGLASHLGLFIQRPTIGCAKKRLVGEHANIGRTRGNFNPLIYKTREVGMVVRTKTGVNPIFVSPGYGLTVDEAMRLVLSCGGLYRIPKPIRQAHLLVNCARQTAEAPTA